ncbi:DNA polymerase III subunits gamma and tau [Williamsoniiplasma somnilux]|uniref:DNA polymerase III subunit gamma/tau n=1 Tax=Williamsoniiplasma somnilux TaxID=215578 RepID=A0A2K8NZY1_9MOLU|nr:DNA polymerase III subunit gamma/tau [Williamsoniiplasma somnilux]ATZ19106.1 DNA polymerase III subunits gamma and tau [Williamsoniiplasma somnilux]
MFKNKSSLYRIYRPSTFAEIAGHTNIVNILKTELKNNSFTHAFLFTGQRGTGKTSIARIFAKAVNCKNLNNADPCDNCESCITANEGKSPDIFEIDAASNNGVDEMRNVKSNVSTMPILGKYKVYIIDEVHMLSKGAFNALLKTLEEPPAHAIFILATTEYIKIPATIISRCQTFNFKKIDKLALENKLNMIAKKEGFSIDKETTEEIYFLSDGSLRDALNILEQLMIVNNEVITIESLKSIFYVATKKEKFSIIKNIINNETEKLINYFEIAENQGMDFDVFALSLIEMIKEIIEYKLTKQDKYLKLVTVDEINELKCSVAEMFNIADNLSDAYSKSRGTNVNFHYILISLLKSLKSNFDDSYEKVENQNNLEAKFNIEKANSENKTKIIDQENISSITEEEIPKECMECEIIPSEVTEIGIVNRPDFSSTEEVKKVDQVDEIIFKSESINEEQNSQINTWGELLELSNKEIFSEANNTTKAKIEVDAVVTMLQGANREARDHIESIIYQWFKYDENENLLDKESAKSFIAFKDTKVSAVSKNEILLVCESSIVANAILNSLMKSEFRNKLFNYLKQDYVIYPIDKSKWEHVKKEFSFKKSNNLLTGYNPVDSNIFYKEISESTVNLNPKAKELLEKATSLFGDIEVKIND